MERKTGNGKKGKERMKEKERKINEKKNSTEKMKLGISCRIWASYTTATL